MIHDNSSFSLPLLGMEVEFELSQSGILCSNQIVNNAPASQVIYLISLAYGLNYYCAASQAFFCFW